jgi:hypothetical protein
MPSRYRPPKPKTARPIDLYACLLGDLSSLAPAKPSKSPRKAPTRHASFEGNGMVAGSRGKCLKQLNLTETGKPCSVDHEG